MPNAVQHIILAQFVKTAILSVIRAVLSFHTDILLVTRLRSAGDKPYLHRLVAESYAQLSALIACVVHFGGRPIIERLV